MDKFKIYIVFTDFGKERSYYLINLTTKKVHSRHPSKEAALQAWADVTRQSVSLVPHNVQNP